jgi:hypothetical protein
MARKRDTKRPRSVKAEIDDQFGATSHAGAILYEKLIRGLGLRKTLAKYLPERVGVYTSADVAEQMICGLLLGDKGFQATRSLRANEDLAKIFGYSQVVDDATVYRFACELAGLEQRNFDEVYVAASPGPVALDIFGREKSGAKHRRVVPEEPERMTKECFARMSQALREHAVRCGHRLPQADTRLMGFRVGHADGTDLEVRGSCFDGAARDHKGNQSLRMLTFSNGPLYLAVSLEPGASDEGGNIGPVLGEAKKGLDILYPHELILALMDAAYAERDVINRLQKWGWKYIVCANQYREALRNMCEQFPEGDYQELNPDPKRGWSRQQVCVFRHQPEGWTEVQRVMVRRWQKDDELGIWHYSFLYTNLAVEDLPKKKVAEHGYAQLIWMLYSTKQGHEVTYKTLLTDLGMHHPVSGRMGATLSLIFLAAMAVNTHAVMSRRVVDESDRGIRLCRFVRDYVLIAGKVVMEAGNTLKVRLAGATMTELAKKLWLHAYAKVCAI